MLSPFVVCEKHENIGGLCVLFKALSFNRQADELESWMDDVEAQLSSEDHGKDIISVSNLLKKHQVQWLQRLPSSVFNLHITLD